MTFDEPLPCLFTQETVVQGQPSQLIRSTSPASSRSSLGDQGPYEGLNGIALQLNGPEDIVQKFGADGTPREHAACRRHRHLAHPRSG